MMNSLKSTTYEFHPIKENLRNKAITQFENKTTKVLGQNPNPFQLNATPF